MDHRQKSFVLYIHHHACTTKSLMKKKMERKNIFASFSIKVDRFDSIQSNKENIDIYIYIYIYIYDRVPIRLIRGSIWARTEKSLMRLVHEIPAQRTTVMLNSNLLVISRGSWPTSYDHLFLFILYLP